MPKRNNWKRWIFSVASVAVLAACSGKPTGQVVAKVAGDEITTADLKLEMSQLGAGAADPSAVQQRALETLIARKILYHEAVNRKLDTTPDGKLATSRAHDLALIDLLRDKIASNQPLDSSDTAVNQYIVSHPSQFADRKLITADQLTISSTDSAMGDKLKAMGDLSAVEAYLTANKIAFVRSASVIDTAQLPPDGAAKLAGLTTGALYASVPAGGAIRLLRIMSTEDAPLIGSDARSTALSLMQATRAQAAVVAIKKIVDNAKSSVWIDPSFAGG